MTHPPFMTPEQLALQRHLERLLTRQRDHDEETAVPESERRHRYRERMADEEYDK